MVALVNFFIHWGKRVSLSGFCCIMLNASFYESEVKESHIAYVSMISRVLIEEFSTFLTFKERFKYVDDHDCNLSHNQPAPSSDRPQCNGVNDSKRLKLNNCPPLRIEDTLLLNTSSLNLVSTSE